MNKKIIIVVVIVTIAVLVVVAFLFVHGNSPASTGGSGTSTGILPPVATTTPVVVVAPIGTTITFGTNQGSVTTNNFYKTAAYVTQDQQTVVLAQTSIYSMVYNVSDSSFIISILAMPFKSVRQAAEATFLSSLGVSQQDACKLDVHESVPASVSDQYIGQVFSLSFCNTSGAFQQ